jgi:site-specific DNA-methyltransferase (adenine-specific)
VNVDYLSMHSRNPDILECLANLSSDEVFTPPSLANAVLDLLPRSIWEDPSIRILDPCSKSGVFLREAAKRLMVGLCDDFPDEDERRDHVFRNMLFGVAITELTSLISRRSVYCSKDATTQWSIIPFDAPGGNIGFRRGEHDYRAGKCIHCGAPKGGLDRGDHLENHAYQFIHEPIDNVGNMKFDVIIGNPPYQLKDDGYGASASPIYHLFVERAKALKPRYLSMIIPARWYSGGKGLDGFRASMLKDRRMRELVDMPKLFDAFPGVKIRGGVCYFLWDREHDGECTVRTLWDGEQVGDARTRYLDQYDVLIRRNEAVSVLEKVKDYRVDGEPEGTFDQIVSSRKPFGFATNFHGGADPTNLVEPLKFYGSQRVTWIERDQVIRNHEWIDKWKILMTRVQGTSAAIETKFLSNPIIAGPGEACSETYLVAGVFGDQEAAENCAAFLRTRFARFLVSLRRATQDATRDAYAFIPFVPMDRVWTDEDLYERYGLNAEEIAFIEHTVHEMPPREPMTAQVK